MINRFFNWRKIFTGEGTQSNVYEGGSKDGKNQMFSIIDKVFDDHANSDSGFKH